MTHDTTAKYPEIQVEISEHANKPMACMAMVRRALQKAGHGAEAVRFTNEALASEPEKVLDLARCWVTVV